jgi:hypothetical protein
MDSASSDAESPRTGGASGASVGSLRMSESFEGARMPGPRPNASATSAALRGVLEPLPEPLTVILLALQSAAAASVIWLYRAGKDNVWLRLVPCTWHAGDAIERMRSTGLLSDWARLFALYPGW